MISYITLRSTQDNVPYILQAPFKLMKSRIYFDKRSYTKCFFKQQQLYLLLSIRASCYCCFEHIMFVFPFTHFSLSISLRHKKATALANKSVVSTRLFPYTPRGVSSYSKKIALNFSTHCNGCEWRGVDERQLMEEFEHILIY